MNNDLIINGHIIQTLPDITKAENSLKLAESKIKHAKEEFDNRFYDDAFVSTYTAMFHCARALLFRDGFKERNHYALYEYLQTNYPHKIEKRYINDLNNFRSIRHKVIYGDENVNIREIQETEADSAIKIAKGFLEVVKKLIKQK